MIYCREVLERYNFYVLVFIRVNNNLVSFCMKDIFVLFEFCS